MTTKSNKHAIANRATTRSQYSFPSLGLTGALFYVTTQKMKFSVKDFFSKCDQIRNLLRIWSHLLKKSLMENFISYALCILNTIT